MKKFAFLLMLTVVALAVEAQPPAPGAVGQFSKAPAIGRIYGKVVDSTGKGIADASVLLLQNRMDTAAKKEKEVLLKGVNTQANGDFNMEDLPVMGNYTLSISATGFQPLSQVVSFKPSGQGNAGAPGFEKDLGKISMQANVQQLTAVVVTGSGSSRLRMDIDKKVFNVDQNIVTTGGTAVDVMKNVPSVNVDMDGNVTMRNATPQIYIDGRPTTLTLDQIPADAIESVEVITNPSAKYDASGGNAGILNIILKKNKKSGYNGNVNFGVDKRGAVNGGASLNVRQDKVNFTVSGFGNQMKNHNTGSTDIINLSGTPNILVTQDNKTRMNGGFLFGRAGVDYFATNRLTLSLSGTRVHGSFNPNSFLTADSAYNNGEYISYSERVTSNTREFNATGLQGGFKYMFPKKGEELTADFNIFSGKGNNSSLYNTDIYSQFGGIKNGELSQQILGNGTNRFITLQSDYVTPIGGGSAKLEAGVRALMRKQTNNQSNYFYNDATGEFELIPSAVNNYKNTENVYAAYFSFSDNIKDFGYKIGLRAESSDYDGELINTQEKFSNQYPISLFPSVFLSQKLSNRQELQLSYTRRINRPFFLQIIPFIDSTDQLNWTRGNASLKPEFINSLELSYSKTYNGNNTFLASVYYKQTDGLITRYLDTITSGTESRPISTYINANSSRSIGAELTTQNTLTKWWDMNANINVYNSMITVDDEIKSSSQDAMWSWFAKMNNTFKFPSNFKIQLSGTYQSKTNMPVNQGGGFMGGGFGGTQTAAQGYIKANYGVDVAIQKSFLKNNAASVTLSFNDIFRTRKYDQYSSSEFFIQNVHRVNDMPMIRMNFALKFGQMDMSLFKRKNMKSESEGMQGATQGF